MATDSSSDVGRRHVVMFSSGAGSAVAAKRVAERHGTENLTLLFADVNGEHPDNYRFLSEAAEWVGGELVVLDNDGRTIWDVFRSERFLGNSRVDPCSRALKREPMRAWLEDHHDPADTTVHLGFDISEPHRLPRALPHWEPWHVEAPLLWEPVLWKDQALQMLADAGIEPPLLTRMGWPHANCGGGCVKAGISQFKRLLEHFPETYAEWEYNEEETRQFLNKDVSILRDRRKVPSWYCDCPPVYVEWDPGDVREGAPHDPDVHDRSECPNSIDTMVAGKVRPLTLRALRERVEAEDRETLRLLLADDEGDSCNCMGDYEAIVEVRSS